jgi:predicted enzyme related to lactoylglutathione lyase
LAEFYRQVTGWEVYADEDWHSIAERPDAPFLLSFQRSADYRPPSWPDAHSSMQFHLHVKVADLDDAETRVCALGATLFEHQPDPRTVRVMADPAGHVFCLCPQRTAPASD